MLKFYYSGAPNPTKVALFLEEAELPYEAIPIDTRKGEQHKPEYLAVNPNAKLPAIVDGEVTVFDSNAILLYLAEKTGKFLPAKSDKARGELLSWLMFVATGVVRIPASRCTSVILRLKRSNMPSTVMPSRRNAISALSIHG
jgi:GSH-dependent disulfide-bond oxidoreductase